MVGRLAIGNLATNARYAARSSVLTEGSLASDAHPADAPVLVISIGYVVLHGSDTSPEA